METLREKSDLDALSDRLSRKIILSKKDTVETIKEKLKVALSKDDRGKGLLKGSVFNTTIIEEIIPRLLFKAQSDNSLDGFKKLRKDKQLSDFTRDGKNDKNKNNRK